MNVSNIFADIRKKLVKRTPIDIEEYGLHIELEPLTVKEEAKVLAVCQPLEGTEYINGLKNSSIAYAIKKINDADFESDEEIIYTEDDGSTSRKSKYIFLLSQVEQWPASLRDVIFEAFSDMQMRLEQNIKDHSKYERFQAKKAPTVEAPDGFKRVEEAKEDADATETERMNKQVAQEIEQVELQSGSREQEALNRRR